MKELGNKERTILDYLEHSYSGAKMMNDVDCMNRISNAIAAFNGDVAPIVHAEWKSVPGKLFKYYCTACSGGNDVEKKFCPECGALMN